MSRQDKPVAFGMESHGVIIDCICPEEHDREEGGYTIPLYTHPANEYKPNKTLECSFDLAGFKPPAKTLTDDEITYLAKRFEGVWSGEVNYKGFARALLKKAQQ